MIVLQNQAADGELSAVSLDIKEIVGYTALEK
jgi:hypothetical protein